MNFSLNQEKVTLLLMWWVSSTDGSVDYKEDQGVNDMLAALSFDPYDYYMETKMYISGLSNKTLDDLISRSIDWGNEHFSERSKQKVLQILHGCVESQHEVTEKDRLKLDRIEKGFGSIALPNE